MSSNCPPQLHLSLPQNTTSFKRSFEQFGFDLESPSSSTDASGSGLPSDGHDRTKRARSASSFSDSGGSVGSSRSSTIASGSSTNSIEVSRPISTSSDQRRLSSLSAARNSSLHSPLPTHVTSHEPPRLPTPEIQDIEMMPDYSMAEGDQSSSRSSLSQEFASSSSTSDQYRLSLARFNAFDHQISALRRSPPAEHQSRLSTSAIPFLHSPTDESSSLSESRRGNTRDAIFESTSSIGGIASQRASRRPVLAPFSMPPRVSPAQASPDNFARDSPASPHQSSSWPRSDGSPILSLEEDNYSAFEQRLTSALDVLRSPSPLFADIDNLRASPVNPYTGPAASQRDDDAVSRHQESNAAQVNRGQMQSSVHRSINSSRSSDRARRPLLRRSSASREQYTAPPPPPHERPTPSSLHGDSVPPIFLQELEQWMNDESEDPIGVPAHWETLAAGENESLSSNESDSRNERNHMESRSRRSQSDWPLIWDSVFPPSRRSSDTRAGLDDPSHSTHEMQSSESADEVTWRNARGRVRGSDDSVTGERRRDSSDSTPFSSAFGELWRGPYGNDDREQDPNTRSLSQRLYEFRSRSDHPQTGSSSSSTHAARPSLAPTPLLQRFRPRFNRAGPPPPVVHGGADDSRRRNTRAEMLRRVLRLPDDGPEEPILGSRPNNATQASAQMLLFSPTLPPLLNRPPSPNQPSSRASIRRRPSDPPSTRSAARFRGMHSQASSERDVMDETTPSLAEYYMDLSNELPLPIEDAPHRPGLRRPLASTSNPSHRRSVSSGNLSYRPNDRLEGPGIRGEPTARHGFYDSQSSSISDMASTIANHSGHRRDGSDDSRSTSTSVSRGPFPSLAAEYRRAGAHLASHQLDIPSLPSPDLGGPFTPPTQFMDSFSPSELTGPPSISEHRFAYRSPSPIRETLSRTSGHTPYEPPPSTGGMHRDIDPNLFAPGPFRNTIQRVLERSRARQTNQTSSRAPAIPPLAFVHSDLFPFRGNGTNNNQSSEPESPTYPDHRHQYGQPSPQYSPPSRPMPREPRSLSGFVERQPPRRARPERDIGEPRRPPTDMHTYLMGQARLEGSRIEPLERASNRRGDAEGLSHAIDVLRQDGLSSQRSRQLINRFHRERGEAETQTPPTVSWGDLVRNERQNQWAVRAESAANSYPRYRTSPSSEGPDRPREHVHPRTRARLGRPRPDANSFFPPTGMLREYLGPNPGTGYNLLFGRPRALGDYVRDEDFDASYENLISIAAALGDAKPRATPDEVIARMDKGTFSQWTTPDSDQRCPICLDDYQPADPLLRLPDCSHWLHQECLEQWLKGASTCPVCRKSVKGSPKSPHHSFDDAGPSSNRMARFGNSPGGRRGGDSSRPHGHDT
ncbi:hypothetical protein BD779DRAFT_1548379 [Infundibulicybe gibba]|nr:hypothetical protein BD779DRAFT_1548379 [Infundibulicybe gibba]